MKTFLIRICIYLGTSALGLLITSWVLPGFTLTAGGFLVAVTVFAVTHSVLAHVGSWTTSRFAPLASAGVGLFSTFAALFIAQLFHGGLRIHGLETWLLAPLVVLATTTLGAWLLPLVFLKKRVKATKR
ncbi:phage holin family protein [Paeniglutamicibacter sp. R2-26]|uniref:phage holin family protein n=1 Tax=Paeniglutamicibacter sp. R2-26 TaxID=3144417 RepID=UPI003EE4A3ED